MRQPTAARAPELGLVRTVSPAGDGNDSLAGCAPRAVVYARDGRNGAAHVAPGGFLLLSLRTDDVPSCLAPVTMLSS